ncbi:hypothetical protein COY23_02270 [bacterium (Candidatus Torokbacteria) CG_4_10_14_0_2_um_filter_35_8]|nr:MAG: hypothetical protein COY23_02270 [bacterium (Candidatus Torokbacteria) CG_4_10_14_0_2_um_filter_35_8]
MARFIYPDGRRGKALWAMDKVDEAIAAFLGSKIEGGIEVNCQEAEALKEKINAYRNLVIGLALKEREVIFLKSGTARSRKNWGVASSERLQHLLEKVKKASFS